MTVLRVEFPDHSSFLPVQVLCGGERSRLVPEWLAGDISCDYPVAVLFIRCSVLLESRR